MGLSGKAGALCASTPALSSHSARFATPATSSTTWVYAHDRPVPPASHVQGVSQPLVQFAKQCMREGAEFPQDHSALEGG